MKPLKSTGLMAPGVPTMIVRTIGFTEALMLGLGKMDQRFEGILEGGGKCFWLIDGRRCEMTALPGGGYTAATSKEPDPLYPGKDLPPPKKPAPSVRRRR